jgi:alpha-1,6-mannosyltransferase
VADVASVGALGGLVACAWLLAIGAASTGGRFFVPAARQTSPGWLRGPLAGLGLTITPHEGTLLIAAMSACYALTLVAARGLTPRRVWAAVFGAHLALLLAPPLFSGDVFGYVSYARLFVLHGVDPYVHGAAAAPLDAARPFVVWHDIATPYGPLFSAASFPLALLSLSAALWACKAVAAAASLACVVLVARIARERGRDPLPAVAFFGLNPLLLVYAVGGAHNDLLPVGLTLLAVLSYTRDRRAGAGASTALAAGFKASAGLALPFLLASAREDDRDRRANLFAGAAAGLAAAIIIGLAVFGTGAFDVPKQLHQQQGFVAHNSVPSRLAALLGFSHVPSGLRIALLAGLAVVVGVALWRVWAKRLDWVSGLAWSTLALLIASAWLVPWYAVWLLPLAAVAASRRLKAATLLLSAYVVAIGTAHWLVM